MFDRADYYPKEQAYAIQEFILSICYFLSMILCTLAEIIPWKCLILPSDVYSPKRQVK